MTPTQAFELKHAIRRLVRAEIAHSWIGSQPPEDHEIIKSDLRSAKARVATLIARVTDPKGEKGKR
jgi:hypothetical protein